RAGVAGAGQEKPPTGAAMWGVQRQEGAGPADDEMRRRMRLIIPHIRRAALIGRVIDLKTAEAATFADTVDGISAGMFFVDAGGGSGPAKSCGPALPAPRLPRRAVCGKVCDKGTALRACP